MYLFLISFLSSDADVGKMVDRVLQSEYTTNKKTTLDFSESEVFVFWDIIGCPIPEDFEEDWEVIPRNIKTALKKERYTDELEINVVGEHGLRAQIVQSWSSAGVNFIPFPDIKLLNLMRISRIITYLKDFVSFLSVIFSG